MARLYFASLVTLSLLAAMVAGVVIAAMVALGEVDIWVALAITAVINLVIFLVSPWLTDLSLKWINGVKFLDDAEVRAKYPHVHALTHKIADKYGFKAPSLGIIPDRNPTAFTYGLLRSNARLILTDGIFEFLNEDETRAVVGHELGHIVNRDFLVMTIAGMLVQMLYQVYANLTREKRRSSGGKEDKGAAVVFAIAVASYVFYQLGIFILLYLSRTREYLADSFSAEHVEARHLASALVKIAYGIAEAADTEATRGLLASTRHLGVVDFKGARALGLAAEQDKAHPGAAAEAMLFDIHNPWAGLVQLSSTHPLTGRRIQALAQIAREKRQAFGDYDVEAAAKRAGVDAAPLWRRFWWELCVLVLPYLAGAAVALPALAAGVPQWALLAVPAALAAWIATIFIRFPFDAPVPTTASSLMGDWAASPVVGRPVSLSGEVIGRADAGSIFGEDTIFADKTGRMIVDFRSMLGGLGDFWAGWRRVKPHIGQKGEVAGWFRRSMGGYIIMSRLTTSAGTLTARPYISGAVIFFLVLSLIAAAAWAGHYVVTAAQTAL